MAINKDINKTFFANLAIKESQKALKTNDIPVGAIAVKNNKIIAKAHNQKEKHQNAIFHAEILCILKAAKKLKTWRLNDVEIYSTLEPCPMCAGAMVLSRVKTLYYILPDPKSGAVKSVLNITFNKQLNHKVKSCEIKCHNIKKSYAKILKSFFLKLRKNK